MVSPEQYITRQLIEQGVAFEVLQDRYVAAGTSPVSQTVDQWKAKFISGRNAPGLEAYLWHIFSFGATQCVEGAQATEEYLGQWKTTTLIFNEGRQYLIRCQNAVPIIEMEDFTDDLYIAHKNMKWTYVIPHEIPSMGPYFSTGLPAEEEG